MAIPLSLVYRNSFYDLPKPSWNFHDFSKKGVATLSFPQGEIFEKTFW